MIERTMINSRLESIEARFSQLTKILAHPLRFTRRPITEKSHTGTKKIMYFPNRVCVRPLRHLYGYATAVSCLCPSQK